MIRKYVDLTRELGHFPIESDLMLKHASDQKFPDRGAFSRWGTKAHRVAKVLEYCETHKGFDDLILLVEKEVKGSVTKNHEATTECPVGYVYLLQHGRRREYKIGRTSNPLRREGEIGIELPHGVQPIHRIETDDPSGVESYWHRRFADKRLRSEWFALTPEDVRAFKRWKRIF